MSADYSQIELVVLAHLSGDPALSQAFTEGTDVHSQTAALIFEVPVYEVSPEQRRIAKTINFGIMYGMSGFRLSRELGISRQKADEFITAYFHKYNHIRAFIDKTVEDVETNGVSKTILGRARKIPGIGSRNRTEKMGAERIAVNTPIQGSAADIVKLAMLRIDTRLKQEQRSARLLLQVHDELIFEVPENETEPLEQLLRDEMEHAIELDVPLKVSIETGAGWGELH
jgi:DNA polymerase-1